MIDGRQAQVATDRRRAIAAGRDLPEQVRGSVVFADISGFTALTETLARTLGRRRGAEELSRLLDEVFGAVIDDVHRFNGEVISFAGDAITCFIDGDDGAAATACALAIQETMGRYGRGTTPTGEPYELKIKVVIGVGDCRRFAVGDPDLLLIEALAGSVLDEVAAAEQSAEPGEIVLAPSARTARLGEHTVEERAGAAVLLTLAEPVAGLPEAPDVPVISEDMVSDWVHPGLAARLAAEDARFQAELRPAHTVFVGIDGFDIDVAGTADRLDRFIQRCQWIFDDHGGALIQLTIGDKGAYAYAVFGAVTAHEDDATRAIAAALAILDVEAESRLGSVRVGVSHGRLHIGAYGHPDRQTFGCLGDAANTAARLMMKAEPDTVCTSDTVEEQTGAAFEWVDLGETPLKGKALPVKLRRPVGRVSAAALAERNVVHSIDGRDAELAALVAALSVRGVTLVSADAGMGKSHLVDAALAQLPDATLVVSGETPTFGAAPYAPWHAMARGLLGIPLGADDPEVVEALIEQAEVLGGGRVRRVPLLGTIFGIEIADNDLTASLEAKVRKVSAENLLGDLIAARPPDIPVVVVVDDIARLDPLSLDLFAVVRRATGHLSIHATCLTREPPEAVPWLDDELLTIPPVVLTALSDEASESVVRGRLAELYGDGVVPSDDVVAFISERGEGNPLYLSELASALHRRGVDVTGPAPERDDLPDGLASLLQASVDVLPEPSRRTIKIAGVVGRTFEESVVSEAESSFGSDGGTRARLLEFEDARVAEPVVGTEDDWRFRNVLTRDVVYESLPHAVRISVHDAVSRVLEHRPDAGAMTDRIAEQVWLSESDRRAEWAERAGREAQGRYANQVAITWFERLSSIVEGSEKVSALQLLGEVHEVAGNWTRAAEAVEESLELACEIGDRLGEAWAETALGEIERRQGHFDLAEDRLDRAAAIFTDLDHAEGRGRVFHLAGTLMAQQGNHAAARAAYEESLRVRTETGDVRGRAAVLSNLGVVAEYERDYAGAERFHRLALDLREDLGDPWAIAVSNTNLGMIELLDGRAGEALVNFEAAMRLFSEVGDPWMVAVAHNNRGNARRDEGALAAAAIDYREAAMTYASFGDRWAEAFLLEDVAVLVAAAGFGEAAFGLLGAADRARDDLGSPRPPGLEEDVTERLQSVADSAGARADGRAWSIERSRRELAQWCVEVARNRELN